MNTENLLKLASYLLSGNLKAHFNMIAFGDKNSINTNSIYCGTIGCAVGHGPYAGIDKISNERWNEYSRRVFGISSYEEEWAWCFSSMWVDVDNTPEGAAKRILYLLRYGLPDNWCVQITGNTELTYLNETI